MGKGAQGTVMGATLFVFLVLNQKPEMDVTLINHLSPKYHTFDSVQKVRIAGRKLREAGRPTTFMSPRT